MSGYQGLARSWLARCAPLEDPVTKQDVRDAIELHYRGGWAEFTEDHRDERKALRAETAHGEERARRVAKAAASPAGNGRSEADHANTSTHQDASRHQLSRPAWFERTWLGKVGGFVLFWTLFLALIAVVGFGWRAMFGPEPIGPPIHCVPGDHGRTNWRPTNQAEADCWDRQSDRELRLLKEKIDQWKGDNAPSICNDGIRSYEC